MAKKISMWIARIVATVILASLLSIWTTSYIITSYVQQMLEQYELPLDVKRVAMVDVIRSIWTTEERDRDDGANIDRVANDNSKSPKEKTEATGAIFDDEEAYDEELGQEQPSVEAIAPVTNESEEQENSSSDELALVNDNLLSEDKDEVFQLLMSKLPPDAWQLISTHMEDGLTDAELLEVQQVMALHLTKDEYQQLLSIMTGE